ncbi:hypothetical protein Scep_022697 [Stephania cephalantha]|uniref:DUF177 domain-containing protein n=1 Tax=Stephania cephalantha TaxID=152367 RepID=A0AAP0HY17_9MAGN
MARAPVGSAFDLLSPHLNNNNVSNHGLPPMLLPPNHNNNNNNNNNTKLRVCRIQASKHHDHLDLRSPRAPRRRLISIATADNRWHGKWSCEYLLTLEELQLGDLVEDGQHGGAEVFITITVEKHASFGLSVQGRIVTSFMKKCSNCSSSYCSEIDTTFDVWVLPSKRNKNPVQVPDIGSQDPSVIYVKPGSEVDLDALVQDAIRLASSTKETCSELCEKAEQKWQCKCCIIYTCDNHFSGDELVLTDIGDNDASVDGRWSRLLKLRDRT